MKYQSPKPAWLKEIDSRITRLKEHGIDDMDRVNFFFVIGNVCKRPRMFVGSDSFALTAIFLDGYDYALDRNFEKRRPWGLTSFSFWLGHRLGLPSNISWSYNLSQVYPDDSSAFAQLPQLYEEFLIEQQADPSIQSPI